MKSITWDGVLGSILVGVVFGLLALFGVAISADHSVQGYYIGSDIGGGVTVYAEADWLADEGVFVTDDIDKAIRVARDLNEGLPR